MNVPTCAAGWRSPVRRHAACDQAACSFSAFTPNIHTIDALTASEPDEPDPETVGLREEIARCKHQLTQYRAALDLGSDPAVVTQWITETQTKKLTLKARLGTQTAAQPAPARRMSKEEITAIVTAVTDLMSVLRAADPATNPRSTPSSGCA